jgi:phosphate transport system substrate-binding protein
VEYAVAIALQGVTINSDETQNLEGVYTFPDARMYRVSSYSYMIVPTTTAAPFSAAKGETLRFIEYFMCVGQ